MELLQEILDGLELKYIKKYASQGSYGLTYNIQEKGIPINIYINNTGKNSNPTAWNIQYGTVNETVCFGVALVENEYATKGMRNNLLEQVRLQLRADGHIK